ncbi:DUF4355 domain-containing protein [Anaerosalibacter massiliensis]|uniref:DUF4355 domain-containing protein n=1 Tax=Anaerosalibacter massiliensis TaxID=1347392 RepID=A0A9X2S6B9_9FIRM|nr:DUF4355 domain-containing protein [Anaerosalibacter massiliensis]MCR2045493.1 DUF4355 domain-containing protein [Anaerosalibacter massiliensis]
MIKDLKKGLPKMNLQLFAEEEETEEIVNKDTEKEDKKKLDTKENQKKEDDKKYSDEDLDRIINEKFAKWQEKKEKEINEAKKLADMNAQQKAEYERDQLQKELDELRKANTLNEMTSTARNMLKERNVSIDDELLSTLVTDDAEKTKENVESFANMFEEAVEKAVLEKIKNPNEKRGTTSGITKEEIMQIKDRGLRQQKIKENIHLFNE